MSGAGGSGEGAELPERLRVTWEGGHRFSGGREGLPAVLLDGEKKAGPGAVDAVTIALATCAGIDVVEFLEKRRTPPESLAVDVRYARVNGTPRRLEAIHLLFRVRADTELHHVERAVSLAVEKYCSVASSLSSDVRLTSEVDLERP